jgi:uncharacterized protein (TIGR00290 family)
MHGVRRELILDQADALGLPLLPVEIGSPANDGDGLGDFPSNAAYEEDFCDALRRARKDGIDAIAFGDIFLADLRRYREDLLARAGLSGVFPLWGEDTSRLLGALVEGGWRATVVCVDGARLPAEWTGRVIDGTFAGDLPAGVDPCGENGEFHTFVHDGPGFSRPVPFSPGIRVFRDPFWFLDLVPCRKTAE